MTLHERLLAEIERREEIARKACLGYDDGGEWEYTDSSSIIRAHPPHLSVIRQTFGTGASEFTHIALHDPGDALRRYARDRKVLERHQRDHIYDEYVWSCVRCTDGDCVAVEWPCDDIRDLAESLGVPIEEA